MMQSASGFQLQAVGLFVCLFVGCLFVCLLFCFVCLFVGCLFCFVCLFVLVCLAVGLFVCLWVRDCWRAFQDSFVYLFDGSLVSLSVCLFAGPTSCMFVCLFVCLFIHCNVCSDRLLLVLSCLCCCLY